MTRTLRQAAIATVAVACASGFVAALVSCGTSDSGTGSSFNADGGGGDATSGDGSGLVFTEGGDHATSDVLSTETGGGDGGTGGLGACASCAPGQVCSDGGCACPPYQALCNGACIATSGDPTNCGGCGTRCTGSQVCSANACAAGCLLGLTACSGACVDLNSDSNHCGACATKCGSGTGCAGGTCVPSVALNYDAGASHCVGGGPPIDVGVGDAGATCTGNLAQVSFRFALCSCTNLDISAPLTTDGYDSTKGGPDGGLGGSVGCDLTLTNWSQSVSVGGDLWAADAGTFMPSGPGSVVRNDLHLGGTLNASSPFTVDGSAYVVGSVSGATVRGTTSHPSSIPAPCDCAPSQLVPVGTIVAVHRSLNDDTTIGLDPQTVASDAGAGPLRIDLPCGNYYFAGIRNANPLTIYAHGHVGLYIEGDLGGSAPLAFGVDPTGTLDIFVSGTINTSQLLTIGSPNYPALCRLYVGGTAKLTFSQNVNIGCNIYAADSQLVDWSATSAIYGSIFAGNFKASHDTFIHYDRGVLGASIECPPPGGPGGGGDGGTGTGGTDGGGGSPGSPPCGSCRDCNNQACTNGVCGSCSSSSDCCSPLVCAAGVCVALQ